MNNSILVHDLIEITKNINNDSLFCIKEKLYKLSEKIKNSVSKELYKKLRLDLETIELELLYNYNNDYKCIIKEGLTKTISEIIDDIAKIRVYV